MIAEDGRKWRLVLEGYDIPDHKMLGLFPEINTCVKDYWKIFDRKRKSDFLYIDGWFGRSNELGLTIFIREDLFDRYSSEFNKIDNRTSIYDEMILIEELLHIEEPIWVHRKVD